MKAKTQLCPVNGRTSGPLLFEAEIERFSGISRMSTDLHSELAERHESSEKALMH